MDKNELRKLEFALDRKRSDYQAILAQADSGMRVGEREEGEAQIGFAKATEELRQVQRSLYGWRFVAETYGDAKKFATVDIESLRARILDLETQETQHKWVLDNYEKNLAGAKEKVEKLKADLASDVGFKPKPEEIQKAQDELLAISRNVGVAEVALPAIQQELGKLRNELDTLGRKRDKVFTRESDMVYASPGDELDAKAQIYAAKHGISYTRALHAVIEADPDLAEIYLCEDQLLT
jgi:chromosome segregation ATPase